MKKKNQIYIVITNGEVQGEVEGAYASLADAKAKLEEIKKDWNEWAANFPEDEIDYYEDEYSYYICNEEEDMEVRIVPTTLQGKEDSESCHR